MCPEAFRLPAPSAPATLAALQLSGPYAQSPGKEGFSPDLHLACALLPSGLYSDTTFPVRPALPLFPDTLYPLPCLIFSLPITTSHYRMYFAYLPLFVVCLFQEE